MRKVACILLWAAFAGADEAEEAQRRAEACCADATARIEAYLGKKFKAKVPVEMKTGAEMAALAREDAKKHTPPDLIEAWQKVCERLHLVEPGYDLFEKQIAMLEVNALGIYDPDGDRFYVLRGVSADSAEFKVTVAHELVHAYRDVDKDYWPRSLRLQKTNGDEAQALRFLFEGDATLLGYAIGFAMANEAREPQVELYAGPPPSDAMVEQALAAPALAEFPLVLKETLVVAYIEGCAFAGAIFRAGGREALAKAYDRPPRSTEQALHPEKYLSEPDEPTEFEGGDPTAALGDGWRLRYTDVLGEFDVRLLFAEKLGRRRAQTVAAGWDGSRYWLCEKEGSPAFFGIATVWDAEADAGEFAQAWADWALQRDGKEGTAPGSEGEWRVETKDGLVVVLRKGTSVFVADGVPRDRVEPALAAMASARAAERKAE
jgi:hypothetical protein